MDVIKIEQLDYKYILIEIYKQFGLNEQELVILLLIDNAEKEAPSLITADQLVLKMSLEEKQIDVLSRARYRICFIVRNSIGIYCACAFTGYNKNASWIQYV